jgi:Polyketide cyclase / dehydrase and lipid transport
MSVLLEKDTSMPTQTEVSIIIPHTADQTWSVIRDFDDYLWGEGVGLATTDTLEPNHIGTVRQFKYYGQPSMQSLPAYDAANRTMSWESVEPFDETLSYNLATIQFMLVKITETSFVKWSVEFDASPNATQKWIAHQKTEFHKSLERLSLCVGWAVRCQAG